jgi:hypothetical protein
MNKNVFPIYPIYPVLGLSLKEAKKVLLNNKVKIITEDNNLITGTIIIENIEATIHVLSSRPDLKTHHLHIRFSLPFNDATDYYNEFKNILINQYGEPQEDFNYIKKNNLEYSLVWEDEVYRINVTIDNTFSYRITNKLVLEDNKKLKRESFKKLLNYLFNKN